MKKLSLFLLSLLIIGPTWAAPKLVVLVVIDQFRADYLEKFNKNLHHGFKKLMENGAVFEKAHIRNIPSDTGPGHATIMTGKMPSAHGIIGNQWWDREKQRTVKSVVGKDNILSPDNLMADTLGDYLKKSYPNSRVVAIGQKDRSSIFMGGHQPDLVLWYGLEAGEYTSSSYYKPRPDWVDSYNKDLQKLGAPHPRSRLRTKKKFLRTSTSDWVLLELAKRAVSEMKLGQSMSLDLLSIGFSATDKIGHLYGPDSEEMKSHLIELDKILDQILDVLNQQVGESNYALVLTSDHGVIPIPKRDTTRGNKYHRVIKKELREKIEAIIQDHFGDHGQKWVEAFHPPHLFLNRTLADRLKLNGSEMRETLSQKIAELDDVAHVYVPGQWSQDEYVERYKESYYPPRSGDIMIRMKKGVLLTPYESGTTHGSPYEYDTHVPLIFYGSFFKKGRWSDEVGVNDIVPTLGHLLDLSINPKTGSRALLEILN